MFRKVSMLIGTVIAVCVLCVATRADLTNRAGVNWQGHRFLANAYAGWPVDFWFTTGYIHNAVPWYRGTWYYDLSNTIAGIPQEVSPGYGSCTDIPPFQFIGGYQHDTITSAQNTWVELGNVTCEASIDWVDPTTGAVVDTETDTQTLALQQPQPPLQGDMCPVGSFGGSTDNGDGTSSITVTWCWPTNNASHLFFDGSATVSLKRNNVDVGSWNGSLLSYTCTYDNGFLASRPVGSPPLAQDDYTAKLSLYNHTTESWVDIYATCTLTFYQTGSDIGTGSFHYSSP